MDPMTTFDPECIIDVLEDSRTYLRLCREIFSSWSVAHVAANCCPTPQSVKFDELAFICDHIDDDLLALLSKVRDHFFDHDVFDIDSSDDPLSLEKVVIDD